MTFYATPATGAAWIVPKKYTERVGRRGFQEGAGPGRALSIPSRFNPGIELVVEAYEGYWRKTPAVKRLVFKSVPDEAPAWPCSSVPKLTSPTRSADRTPRGEADGRAHAQADVADLHGMDVFTEQFDVEIAVGGQARAARRQPRDRSQDDQRGRVSRYGQAGVPMIPPRFRVPLGPAAVPVRPARPSSSCRAGYPKGFDAVEMATDAVYAPEAEAVINGFQAIGIRARLQPMERAGFYKADQEKDVQASGPRRQRGRRQRVDPHEAFVISTGIRSYGGYPDIDALFRDQAAEMDKKRREAMLHRFSSSCTSERMFGADRRAGAADRVGGRLAEAADDRRASVSVTVRGPEDQGA